MSGAARHVFSHRDGETASYLTLERGRAGVVGRGGRADGCWRAKAAKYPRRVLISSALGRSGEYRARKRGGGSKTGAVAGSKAGRKPAGLINTVALHVVCCRGVRRLRRVAAASLRRARAINIAAIVSQP